MVTFRDTSNPRLLDVERDGTTIGYFYFDRGMEPRYVPSYAGLTAHLTVAEMQSFVDEYERRKPWRIP